MPRLHVPLEIIEVTTTTRTHTILRPLKLPLLLRKDSGDRRPASADRFSISASLIVTLPLPLQLALELLLYMFFRVMLSFSAIRTPERIIRSSIFLIGVLRNGVGRFTGETINDVHIKLSRIVTNHV